MGLFDDVRNAGQAVLGAGQKGLGLVGSGLQALGGAMGGTAGTPGINPAAPDPRQGGLGLAKPTPPITRGGIENGPQDLSDLPFVTRLVLALDDGFKHNEGMVGEGDRLRMQRQQAAEQRKLAWKQNIEVVDKFRAFLDTVPVTERDSRAAKLRQKYVTEFGGPGSEELFDTIIGAGGDGEGLSTALLHHPKVQLILANNPRASMADIKQAMNEPDFWPTAQKIQDDALLPSAEKKVQSLLNPQSPTLLARAQELGKNGYTIEEIKQLNELAGEGPEGSRLTPGELATLERQQGAIAQRIPGFKTTAEFDEERKKAAELADFEARENIKFEHYKKLKEMELEQNLAKSGLDPAQRQVVLADYRDNLKQLQTIGDSQASLADMDRILENAEKVLKGNKVGTGAIQKYTPDALRTNPEALNALQQAFGTEWFQAVQNMRGLGHLSDREGLVIGQTTGGLDKEESFNLKDIQARRRLLKTFMARKKSQKAVAETEINNLRRLAELPERGFAGSSDAPAETPTKPGITPEQAAAELARRRSGR